MEFLLKFFADRKYLIIIDIKKRNIFIILKKDIQSTEILEAYFYAFMCGFYICMAKKIPIVSSKSVYIYLLVINVILRNLLYKYFNITKDLLLRSETSEPSYPLLNIYILYKKFMESNSNMQLSIPNYRYVTVDIQSIYATDLIVCKEYKTFCESLDINGIYT